MAKLDRGTLVAALVLCALVAALYARALGYPLLIGDDNYNIRYNPFFHPLTWANLGGVWTKPYLDLYIPVTLSAWGVLGMIAKAIPALPRAALMHGTNLMLHWVNCLLVFLVARDMLAEAEERPVSETWVAAVFGAALFAVHPMQVKNVAWVTGLKDLLGTLFSLLALRSFHRAAVTVWPGEQGDIEARARSFRSYHWSCLWFLLGILSKPSSVVLPLLALIMSWTAGRPWWKSVVPTLPWVLVSAAITAWTFAMQGLKGTTAMPFWLRPLGALDNLAFYAAKFLFPYPLAHEITHFAAERVETAGFWVGACAACGALALGWLYRRKARAFVGGLLFAAAGLSPILGLVTYGHQVFSEVATHYIYLPMAGLAWSLGAFPLGGRVAGRRAAAVAAIAAFAAVAWAHVSDYANDDALIARIQKYEPDNNWAHTDLAVSMFRRGLFDQAVKEAAGAAKILPYEHKTHERLLIALILAQRMDEALAILARDAHPDFHQRDSKVDYAFTLILAGRVREGVERLEEVSGRESSLASGLVFGVLAEARYLEGKPGDPTPVFRANLTKAQALDPTLHGIARLLEPMDSVSAM